jgi:hypothetical protein
LLSELTAANRRRAAGAVRVGLALHVVRIGFTAGEPAGSVVTGATSRARKR